MTEQPGPEPVAQASATAEDGASPAGPPAETAAAPAPEAPPGEPPPPATPAPAAAAATSAPSGASAAAPPPTGPAGTARDANDAEDGEGDDDPFTIIGAWVRAHPLFALLLVFITCVLPYGVWSWRASAERARLSRLQDAWQEALSGPGLPVPWVPDALVPAPPGIDLPGNALDALGLGARQRALVAWQTLLAGGQVRLDQLQDPLPVGGPPDTTGAEWLAAVRACTLLREAAAVTSGAPELVARAREEAQAGPGAVRDVLGLAADLVEGWSERVAVDAARLLEQSPHPAARGALAALRDEARRQRIDLALAEPSPELIREAARLARDGAPIVGPLAERGAALAPVVVDLATAGAALELFAAAAPDGVARRPELQTAWEEVSRAVRRVLAEGLRQFDDDPTLALQVLERLVRVDPTADAPVEGFVGWREHLQRVVNDPPRLRRFAERAFELGWTPAGLDELLASRTRREGAPGAATPVGAHVLDALLATTALLELPPEERAADAAAVGSSLLAADEAAAARLGDRQDPIARRVRAQLAFLRGRFDAALEPGGGLEALERAGALGYEPRARLLEALARAREARGETDAALAAAQERVDVLEALARRLGEGLSPEQVVEWDLRGWPADALTLGGERTSALLDLAALLARAGRGEEAVAAATRAAGVHPDHAARAHLARAQLLLAERRADEAREALLEAQATVRPHERALRDRIQALLDALPPR